MKQLLQAFAPATTFIVLMLFGIFQNVFVLAVPSLFCGLPISLFWAGYYVGRNGAKLQSPIKFLEVDDDPVPSPPKIRRPDKRRIARELES